MKKSIDEKKQKWDEARAKYVIFSSFRFTYLISKSVTLCLKAEVSTVRLLSTMTFFSRNTSPYILINYVFLCYYSLNPRFYLDFPIVSINVLFLTRDPIQSTTAYLITNFLYFV